MFLQKEWPEHRYICEDALNNTQEKHTKFYVENVLH